MDKKFVQTSLFSHFKKVPTLDALLNPPPPAQEDVDLLASLSDKSVDPVWNDVPMDVKAKICAAAEELGHELNTTARRDKYLRRRLVKCKKSSAHIKIVKLLCDAVGNNMKTVQKILIGQFPDIFSKQKVSYHTLCRWRRFSYRDHRQEGRRRI